jgi:tRNA-uridine 2-sulfurtransferase
VGRREELATWTVGVRGAVLHRDGSHVDRVKLRHRSLPLPAAIAGSPAAGAHERLELALREPAFGVAPGQTAVLLHGEALVGHATIA